MRAVKLLRAVDAEGVIPDDPAAAGEIQFILREQFDFGGVFVTNRDLECAVGFQDSANLCHPSAGPVEIAMIILLVVVDVVFVADVERRVSEGQIDNAGGQLS